MVCALLLLLPLLVMIMLLHSDVGLDVNCPFPSITGSAVVSTFREAWVRFPSEDS